MSLEHDQLQSHVHVEIAGRGYEVLRSWAPAPEGVPKGRISTLAVDSEGQLYVLRRGVDPPSELPQAVHRVTAEASPSAM